VTGVQTCALPILMALNRDTIREPGVLRSSVYEAAGSPSTEGIATTGVDVGVIVLVGALVAVAGISVGAGDVAVTTIAVGAGGKIGVEVAGSATGKVG
jgi:hypothetical protein